ncbi:MAG TPA: phosphoribosylaminoimidazolesuccinocarboxamide synthase [Mycobacteriales bacterium]|jgi:phosphoribosylaminoimidazole-succinocarboxamide synthase|nr:phosphoribosylaminoimidazolesuccinocarboxamide synthase [Mycobacteriales bacterium]
MTLADLTALGSGKVRDLYQVDKRHLLIVASDRISAYDWVLPTEIPDKGRVLTALSTWWFGRIADVVRNHLISVDDPRIPVEVLGRAMLVRRLSMVPVECVARGYLAGSGTKDYQASGEICGIPLPEGLVEGSQLPETIFTPATKAEVGSHDENVDYETVVAQIGAGTALQLSQLTVEIYERGAEIARERGIILADTKFEFGIDDSGRILIGDEVLTPDSSRFWPADQWEPGRSQPSYDKQFVRDWLVKSGWDRASPPPELPDDVVAATRQRYIDAYEQLTGLRFSDWMS